MQFQRTRRAKDLDNGERQWLEHKTGQHLADNQPVFIMYELPKATRKSASADRRQNEALRDLIAQMEQLPVTKDDSFCGKDHDAILYGPSE